MYYYNFKLKRVIIFARRFGGKELIAALNCVELKIVNDVISVWNIFSISSVGCSNKQIASQKKINECIIDCGLKNIDPHNPLNESLFSGESLILRKLRQNGLINLSKYVLTFSGLANASLPIQIDKFWIRDLFIYININIYSYFR